MTFAEWLREKLREKDVSARRFGMKIGVSATTANTWANGEGYPTRDKLPAIAEYFDLDVEEVWDAYRELPARRHTDVTLARLLDLPDDLRHFEVILLRNIFRAIRETERETEEADLRGVRRR